MNRLRVGAAGITLPGYKVIYYPELGLWDSIDKSTIIHERNHAGDYGDERMVNMIFWDDVNEYGKKFSNYNSKKQSYLLDGIKKSDYYDDAKEIKSRLMEFRYNNKLNPTHIYSIDEIKQMRNNENIEDVQLFNRYNDDFIYHLLNDIVYNDNKKGRSFAKFGLSLISRPSLKHGGIYIKPSHRGRFTALKERTGHSASWFKENGTTTQKKMATFALNAAKWKH